MPLHTMLKDLVFKYGKQKVNSLTKYPSILTLHKLGDKGRLTDGLTTDIFGEQMFATEKIDGTNVRIVLYGNEYLIGSREFILHHNHGLYFDPAQGIVDGLFGLGLQVPPVIPDSGDVLTVVYGELYGGKVSSGSKNYGMEGVGFRVFDVAVFHEMHSVLEMDLEDISRWRERETAGGMVYGQNFLSNAQLLRYGFGYDLVPSVSIELSDFSHRSILDNLRSALPKTLVALSDSAQGRPEGVILRNADRSKIVKVRFEDYERTLR